MNLTPPRPHSFAGLPIEENIAALDADIAIIGVADATPYQAGVTSHASGAPQALRDITHSRYGFDLDNYDFDLGGTLLDGGGARAVDCGDVATSPDDGAANRAKIESAVRTILAAGAVPVVLGGDDSVPIPMFQAFEGQGPLTVLQLDAHIDWRDEVGGVRHGFSSTMRRASELPFIERIVQVGARGVGSAGAAEVETARSWGAHLVTARAVHDHGLEQIVDLIPQGARCLITLDCDVLDPSIVPGVIGPVPGGLSYHQVVSLIDAAAHKASIAGFDIIEFVPDRDVAGIGALNAARIVCHATGRIARACAGR